jgi:hypothetical protein
MANYTKSTNFAIKDSLISGDPAKVVKGTEIDTELVNIQSAVNSKRDSASSVSLSTEVSGTLPVANGGTGATTLTGVLRGNGTSAISVGNVNLSSEVSNTLPAANGGTAQSTYTTGDLIYASASNTLAKRAIGSTGQVLTVTGGVPTWATPTGGVTPAASSVDNGVVLFSGTGGATLKSSAAQDGFIYGVRIGRGASEDSNNAILGRNAGNSLTTGAGTTLIGGLAGEDNTTGGSNVFIGVEAGRRVTTGDSNVAIGSAAFAYSTSIGAEHNVAIGHQAMSNGTTGNDNVVVGRSVLGSSFDGSLNVVVGGDSGNAMTSADNNVLIGANTGSNITTGGGNVCLGGLAGTGSSPFNITTEFQRVVMGSSSITNAYIQVAWTVVSDGRDKEDVEDAPYGLDFVNRLRPVQYKWDKRYSYYETTEDGTVIKHEKDGSKKEDKLQLGFIAQDVIALEKEFGAVDTLIGDEEQEDSLKVTETKFIPVLVKAIQELKAELDSVKAELSVLKGAQ